MALQEVIDLTTFGTCVGWGTSGSQADREDKSRVERGQDLARHLLALRGLTRRLNLLPSRLLLLFDAHLLGSRFVSRLQLFLVVLDNVGLAFHVRVTRFFGEGSRA